MAEGSTRLSTEELDALEKDATTGFATNRDVLDLIRLCRAAWADADALREDLAIAQERGDAWRSTVKEDTVALERVRRALRDLTAAIEKFVPLDAAVDSALLAADALLEGHRDS